MLWYRLTCLTSSAHIFHNPYPQPLQSWFILILKTYFHEMFHAVKISDIDYDAKTSEFKSPQIKGERCHLALKKLMRANHNNCRQRSDK